MSRTSYLTGVFLLLCYLAFPVGAADIYRWVDDKGVVHFSDNPYNIPQKYRQNTTQIKAKEPPPGQQSKAPFLDKASSRLQKKGAVVIVPATLNERAEGQFIVDTGASYTMISHATAKELSIDLSQKFPTMPFQTANGVVHAPLVKLDSIDVGGLQVRDLTAAVHDVFPDAGISGLLGLNFLSNFRLDIDTEGSILHLERK
ncbi:MAG: TIGR02281 family clan AA aspartic protease [Deltaproteobacteria bacterium]|nr:TIGR02281 family clan AA aspartic protease [Deltaproteobacteria bacterium]